MENYEKVKKKNKNKNCGKKGGKIKRDIKKIIEKKVSPSSIMVNSNWFQKLRISTCNDCYKWPWTT